MKTVKDEQQQQIWQQDWESKREQPQGWSFLVLGKRQAKSKTEFLKENAEKKQDDCHHIQLVEEEEVSSSFFQNVLLKKVSRR